MLEEVTNLQETPMAVSKKDLEGLSGKQLKKLLEDASALQQERRAGRIQELRQKWATEADEEGFSISEVIGIQKAAPGRKAKGDGTRTPAAMKYRLPNGVEWSGKGRLPIVLREALKGVDGYNEEDATFESSEYRNAALKKFLI